MKPSDVQQMMQRYKLIVEENGGDSLDDQFIRAENEVRDAFYSLNDKVEAMRNFFKYAENFDFEMDYTVWAENWEESCRDIFR